MTEPRWLTEARQYIGTKEAPGAKNNPAIVKWWSMIRAPFTDDLTPWCAGFVGAMLESVGIKSSRSAAARSYLKWGRKLLNPALGCIVVFERGPRNGHVGFLVGKDARGNLMILGGNQGDAVNIKPFSKARVLGYRWPSGEDMPSDFSLPKTTGGGKLSTHEALMSGPVDFSEEDGDGADEGTLVGKIKHWMNGIGTSAAALLSSLLDWRIAAIVAVVGLIIFCIIWFGNKRR